jgi:hypothetical protein
VLKHSPLVQCFHKKTELLYLNLPFEHVVVNPQRSVAIQVLVKVSTQRNGSSLTPQQLFHSYQLLKLAVSKEHSTVYQMLAVAS